MKIKQAYQKVAKEKEKVLERILNQRKLKAEQRQLEKSKVDLDITLKSIRRLFRDSELFNQGPDDKMLVDLSELYETNTEEHQPTGGVNLHKEKTLNPQTKPKSNSNCRYICIGATAGLAIGLTIAYFAGAATLTPIIAAIAVFAAAAVVGALVVALVGYGVSKWLDKPNVKAHKQPEVQQPCAFP